MLRYRGIFFAKKKGHLLRWPEAVEQLPNVAPGLLLIITTEELVFLLIILCVCCM